MGSKRLILCSQMFLFWFSFFLFFFFRKSFHSHFSLIWETFGISPSTPPFSEDLQFFSFSYLFIYVRFQYLYFISSAPEFTVVLLRLNGRNRWLLKVKRINSCVYFQKLYCISNSLLVWSSVFCKWLYKRCNYINTTNTYIYLSQL